MDEHWRDLPPDVTSAIIRASHAFGDVADLVENYLGIEKTEDDDNADEDDYDEYE